MGSKNQFLWPICFFLVIQGLLILNNDGIGCRDLWWLDDPLATAGYNIYRSLDSQNNWVKLNSSPQPGHFYRDATLLQQVTFTPAVGDFVETGQTGGWGIKLPDIPYSNVVSGRPNLAGVPDVSVSYDGTWYAPLQINPLARTVWLNLGQALPQGGAVNNIPYPDPSTVTTFTVTYYKLVNFVDIYTSLIRCYYTVVSVGSAGELNAPGDKCLQIVNTQQTGSRDYIQQRMVEYNDWMFEQVGEPAWLMLRRSTGQKCGCTSANQNQPRSGCPSCYETGIVGGYYGPYDFLFLAPDTAITRTAEEGGAKVERRSRSVLGPTPIVQNGDMIVRRNGERLVISNVNYIMPRGVILMQEYDVELLRNRDTRYLIPINAPQVDGNGNPIYPAIYNPLYESNPLDGAGVAEPVATTAYPAWLANTVYAVGQVIYVGGYLLQCTTPGTSGTTAPTWIFTTSATTTDGSVVWTSQGNAPQNPWLNTQVPVGRSVVFGNIQRS